MVLRIGLAGFGAATPRPPTGPLGGLAFDMMLRRARHLAPPPPGAYALRVLLRLPERQARRLLPPPPGRCGTTILAALFCDALRRLQRALAVEADGAVAHDLLRLLHSVFSGRLPPPGPLLPPPLALDQDQPQPLPLAVDQDQVQPQPLPLAVDQVQPRPPPPPTFEQVLTGLLYAAVGRVQRALPRLHLRRDRLAPPPPPSVDLARAGLLHAALARIRRVLPTQDHHASRDDDDENSVFFLVAIAVGRFQGKDLVFD